MRLLLYLEWILLGLVTLFLVLMPAPLQTPLSPISLLALIVFGLLGLRLPTQRVVKVLYTVAEFALVILPYMPLSPLDPRTRCIPILGLIIVIRGCQMFRLPGRLLVAALVFAVFLVSLFFRSPDPASLRHTPELVGIPSEVWMNSNLLMVLRFNTIIALGLTVVFVLLLVNALVSERQSRQELTLANERLREYALRIESQATLQERNRIAREIHDSLGHTLTAQKIQLENALLFWLSNQEKAKHYLVEAKQLGHQALQEVSRSVATLRVDPMQGRSLEEMVKTLLRDFEASTQLQPELTLRVSHSISSDVAIAVYRILQEALTNISRHSEANRVAIELCLQSDNLHLRVIDNGKGFQPTQNTTGFGLKGMRERAVSLGGTLQIRSQPGQGCQIQAIVPLVLRQPPAALSATPSQH